MDSLFSLTVIFFQLSLSCLEWCLLVTLTHDDCLITDAHCLRQQVVGRSRDWEAQGELLEARNGRNSERGLGEAGFLVQGELCRDKKSSSGSGACAGTLVVCAAPYHQ